MATEGRRRLSLAPAAWKPLGCFGSRFECLGGLVAEPSGLDDLDEAHVSVHVARSSMNEVEPVRPGSSIVRRPPRSDVELRQEFWTDAGFPTSASRFWERRSPSNVGENPNGVVICRNSPVVEPAASSRMAQWDVPGQAPRNRTFSVNRKKKGTAAQNGACRTGRHERS